MNEPADRSEILRDLSIALVTALCFRLLYLVLLQRAIDMADSIHYIAMAQQFASGDFLNFDENLPVLYSALGTLAHLFIHDWEKAFWLVSMVASTLTLIPVYLLARELHGARSARLMALLMCIWPWLVDYGSRIAPDGLAVFFWFSGLWLLYWAITRGGVALVLAPLTLFALHLTRPEGTFILLGAPVGALLLCFREDTLRYRRLAMFTLQIAVLLTVYALFMRFAVGTATLSYRAPMPGDLASYLIRGFPELVRTFVTLLSEVLPVMLGPLLLVFLGVGIFSDVEGPRKGRLALLILFFCGLQWSLTLVNYSPAPRYIMTVVIALSLWSARGMVLASAQLAERRKGLRCLPLALVATMMLGHFTMDVAAQHLGGIPRTPIEYRIAGHWMRDNLEPGVIISRKPQVGFYAGMPTTGPAPEDEPADLIQRAKDARARYIVIDERYTTTLAPGLAPLLDSSNAPPELRPLRDDLSPWPQVRIVIYEVNLPGFDFLTEDEFPKPDSHMGPDERRRKLPSDE